ncbi:MAG: 50S ribosomal protein L6, partial [Patescibacteria group bacterium]
MTRLSKKPILIPMDVDVRVQDHMLLVKGKKGELQRQMPQEVSLRVSDDKHSILVSAAGSSRETPRLVGTTYVHTRNMISDVSAEFTKWLEIEGVGYRAAVDGKNMVLSLGFSHPIRYTVPDGIAVVVEKNEIRVSGIDRELVGHVATAIRAFRKPEPYKGKGIRYKGEHIIRKAGKKAGAGS